MYSKFDIFYLGFVAGALIFFSIAFFATNHDWKVDAVKRGLAIYCPDTGIWAWKDECN